MAVSLSNKLVIAITSRTLFDLELSDKIFCEKGLSDYTKYQREHESKILEPGAAFPLIKKLLKLNETEDLVEVILLSRNSADTSLRIFNSIKHHDLNITRAAFTNGDSPYRYVRAFRADLFLSAHTKDVIDALNAGCAAASLIPTRTHQQPSGKLKIAFDGDAVLFSDEAERIFQEKGLAAFEESEQKAANTPLSGGPFKGFLSALQRIQAHFPNDNSCPLRTALVTARGAPAHERVIRTLRAWNIRIDEALFLGGLAKGDFLQAFAADIFFDDQKGHCLSASAKHVATGHVPHGIVNQNREQTTN